MTPDKAIERSDIGTPEQPGASAALDKCYPLANDAGDEQLQFGFPGTEKLLKLQKLRAQAIAVALASFERRIDGPIPSGSIGQRGVLVSHIDAFFSEAISIVSDTIEQLDRCIAELKANSNRPLERTVAKTSVSSIECLTPAERRVFIELMKGSQAKQIAFELSLSEATVKAHTSRIFKKLNVHSRACLIALFTSNYV